MGSLAYRAYASLPTTFQNVALSLYGLVVNYSRYGGNFWRYVEEILDRETWDQETLENYQLEHLKCIMRHAYEYVPYYARLWRKIGFNPSDIKSVKDIACLPLITKEEVRARPSDFVSIRYSGRRLIRYTTGGTTGTPLTLYFTPDQVRRNFAYAEARIRRWSGTTLGARTATFLGRTIVPPNRWRPPFWRFNRAGNQELFSIYHLTPETVEYYIREMERFRPEILVGYPTPLYMLSKGILRRGGINVKPKLIWTSSETVLPWHRETIEAAFSTRVTNAYSLAEGVVFASECSYGKLHISPDYGVLELVPCDGGVSKIIGTTLFNYSMPLIRYDTGDLAEAQPPDANSCPCGRHFPYLSAIMGRQDEVVITPRGSVISAAPLSLVFQSRPWITHAQIEQEDTSLVRVKIVAVVTPTSCQVEDLIADLRSRLGNDINIEVVSVKEIPRTVAGKQRFIVSKVCPFDIWT